MKKVIISFIIIFCISAGVGYYFSTSKNREESKNKNETIAVEKNIIITPKVEENSIRTNTSNEKISPNATLILKKKYKDCNHTIKDYVKIPEELVNLTKEELAQKYSSWDIIGFSSKEIVLEKEYSGICGEHYVLKEENGNVTIYKVDENKNETFYKNTDIATEYLADEDKEKLKSGIFVYSKEELNSAIEDFE